MQVVSTHSRTATGATVRAECPTGSAATGGGYSSVNNNAATASAPVLGADGTTPTGWEVSFGGNANQAKTVWVVCAA
jgi:hypothetical protein